MCKNQKEKKPKKLVKFQTTTTKWLASEFIPFDHQRRRQEAFHRLKMNTPKTKKKSHFITAIACSLKVRERSLGKDSHVERSGMPLISLRGVNNVF